MVNTCIVPNEGETEWFTLRYFILTKTLGVSLL